MVAKPVPHPAGAALSSILAWLPVLFGACSRTDPAAFRVERSQEPAGAPLEDVEPQPGDWPWWRGPGRDGKSLSSEAPLRWSRTENIVWRTPVPGRGHGSPSVWGERIFLATADEEKELQIVQCYDRSTGRELWSRVVHEGGFVHRHPKNSHASVTPACDGERVFVAFLQDDAIHVTALDLEGGIVWQTDAGFFETEHGYGSSPVLHGPWVIVNGDNPAASYLAALHRETGAIGWKAGRRAIGSFATPIVGDVAGRPQLLLAGGDLVTSYDPATGDLLWYCEGPADTIATTMAFSGDLVVASGGYPDKEILVIRADGTGDVTGSHVVWREGRGVAYVPSPLIHEGRLYILNDGGVLTCFELETGREIWKGRLDGNFSASPTYAAGRIYVPNEQGETFVLEEGPEFRLVARNTLEGGGFASPVICGGRIYLRTTTALYAIGE